MTGNVLVDEHTRQAATSPRRGAFETRGLKPGIYALQAKSGARAQVPQSASWQIILAQSPFDWPAP
jgi:hypothetical protein